MGMELVGNRVQHEPEENKHERQVNIHLPTGEVNDLTELERPGAVHSEMLLHQCGQRSLPQVSSRLNSLDLKRVSKIQVNGVSKKQVTCHVLFLPGAAVSAMAQKSNIPFPLKVIPRAKNMIRRESANFSGRECKMR